MSWAVRTGGLFGGFLEEIVEGVAGVLDLAGYVRSGVDGGGFGVRGGDGGGGVPSDGDAGGEEGTLVRFVFIGDALGDGLEALETGGGVHVAALGAAVEERGALGAGLEKIETGGEGVGAIEATAGGDTPDEARSVRPVEGRTGTVVFAVNVVVGLAAATFGFFRGGVLVTGLFVFPIAVHMVA